MASTFYSKRLFEKKRFRGARESRPKTFRTVESAETYAKENGIKKFTVEPKGKKFVVLQE
ncbi:hypothetical protein KY334_06810 [Candidatus Woesearchaeota archaeon]|nr:hypothetical protein [Candidatus Woesearchaeota archaeon]